MNVDEATQAAKEYNENFVRQHFPLPSVTYSQRVAITLLAEVERLHAELAACQNLLDETRTELSICGAFHSIAKKEWQLEVERVNRLEAQLAAAKAASEAIVSKLRNEIDHATCNDMRLPPMFGQWKGELAVRVGALQAVIDSTTPPTT
jgi:uncharacterized small protein (DUF1192 family)